MRTLSYSPTVAVYAATKDRYLDLSPDIESCNITLVSNGSSTFSIKMSNESGKYNGVFEPMDRIAIYATKGDVSNKLFTGYINSVDKFKLYQSGFSISGFDTIGLLQRIYWDRYLDTSVELLANSVEGTGISSGYLGQVYALLTKVASWPEESIVIEKEIPSEVIEIARDVYMAQLSDITEFSEMSDDFSSVLSSSNYNLGLVGSKQAWLSQNGNTIADVAKREYDSGVADGTMHLGGKKYWSWFGWSSRNEWCAVFVSWCANQCGYLQSEVLPQTAAAQGFLDWAKTNKDKAAIHHDTSYAPQPGDIVMWDWNENGVMDHVGIVVENLGGTSYRTVEGNNSGGLGYGHDCVRSPEKINDRYTYFVSPKYPSSSSSSKSSTNNGTKEL